MIVWRILRGRGCWAECSWKIWKKVFDGTLHWKSAARRGIRPRFDIPGSCLEMSDAAFLFGAKANGIRTIQHQDVFRYCSNTVQDRVALAVKMSQGSESEISQEGSQVTGALMSQI